MELVTVALLAGVWVAVARACRCECRRPRAGFTADQVARMRSGR